MYIYFWMVLKKTVYWSIILLIFLKISLFYKVRKAGRKKNTGLQRFLQTAVRHRAAHPQSLISEGIHKEQHRDPQC